MKNPSNQVRSVAKPGVALKALRRGHGWTLAEVSRRTGLPTSTLSKIENDKMSPAFDKLARISAGLHVDIAALFSSGDICDGQSGPSGRRSIARAGEGKAIQTKNYAHLYPAWNLLNKSIIPIVAELRVRSLEGFGELIRHPGKDAARDGRCRVLSLCSAPQTQLIAAPAGTSVRGRSAQAGGPHTRERRA